MTSHRLGWWRGKMLRVSVVVLLPLLWLTMADQGKCNSNRNYVSVLFCLLTGGIMDGLIHLFSSSFFSPPSSFCFLLLLQNTTIMTTKYAWKLINLSLSLSLSVCLPVCLCLSLSLCLCLSVCLPVCLSLSLSYSIIHQDNKLTAGEVILMDNNANDTLVSQTVLITNEIRLTDIAVKSSINFHAEFCGFLWPQPDFHLAQNT